MTAPNNPNKYLGTNQYLIPFVSRNRRPTTADYKQPETGINYILGSVWQVSKNPTTGVEGELWMLSKIVANQATWVRVSDGSGTVTSFSFTDGNGFDGTVTNPTTTPALSLTTTVVDTEVMFSSSGAVSGDSEFTWIAASNTLGIGSATSASTGTISLGGSLTGTGTLQGGDILNIEGNDMTLDADTFFRVVTDSVERLRIDDNGAWLLASNPGTATYVLTSNGAGVAPTWQTTAAPFTWNDITSATQTLAVSNGYVTDRAGGVTYTLPATAAFGDIIRIAGKLGAWSIGQNANQQILAGSGSSTVGVGGSIASSNVGDSAELLCTTAGASTVWRVISGVGNLTII